MAKRLKRFEYWEDGFDYCREKNHPVLLMIKGMKAKLFPSGYIVYFDRQGDEIKRRKRHT